MQHKQAKVLKEAGPQIFLRCQVGILELMWPHPFSLKWISLEIRILLSVMTEEDILSFYPFIVASYS